MEREQKCSNCKYLGEEIKVYVWETKKDVTTGYHTCTRIEYGDLCSKDIAYKD